MSTVSIPRRLLWEFKVLNGLLWVLGSKGRRSRYLDRRLLQKIQVLISLPYVTGAKGPRVQ